MASSYSPNLALELPATGDQSGTWGNTTNTNLGTLIEQAISGYQTQAITDGADTTITIPNGASGVARNMYLELTGALTATRNLIVPANKKLYFIYNNTSGGFSVTVKVSGQTGVSVANGSKVVLVSNGTDVVPAVTSLSGSISLSQLTVGPAASSSSLTVTGGAQDAIYINAFPTTNARALTLDAASSTSETLMRWNTNAVSKTYAGVIGTAGNMINGSAQGNFIIRVENSDFLLSTNAGSSAAFKVAAAGNVTINAPSSGTALAVNALSGGTALSLQTTAASNSALTFGASSQTSAVWSMGITSGSLWQLASTSGGITLANTGNVTINAPSSGTALIVFTPGDGQVASFQGGYTRWASTNDATTHGYVGSSLGLLGTGTGFGIRSESSYFIATNGATKRLDISSTGNITVNAPSSGTTLDLSGASGAPQLTVGSAGAYSAPAVNKGVLHYNTSSGTFTIAARSNSGDTSLAFLTSSTGSDATRATVNSTGNWVLNAPSTGTALTLNARINTRAFDITEGTSTLNISTDPSHNWFFGTADAHALTFQTGGVGTSRMSIAAAGNVTVNAPSSGTALAVTGVANAAALVVNGSASTPANSIGNSGTAFTVDCSKSNVHYVTMTGNVAAGSMTISNMQDGQTINIYVLTGAGGFTLGNATGVKWPGGTVGVISTSASATDCITIQQVNSVKYATILKAFA